MECEFPTVQAPEEVVVKILEESKIIAVVGLSPDANKDSHKVAKYMQEQGYKVIPIYPKEEEILGERVYRSLEEVPGPIDIVDVFRKPEALVGITEVCMRRGDVISLWAQKGIVHNEAAEKAKDAGIQVVQNKCLMVEHRNWKGA